MDGGNSRAGSTSNGRYEGFSLKSVCWGYRHTFEETIEGLFREGLIGPQRREATAKFFELLKHADQSVFDHVLKEFLGALNPKTRWLMDLPGIFADVIDLGRELAQSQIHHGVRFFETFGKGGFGDSPEQVRALLTHVRRLRQTDQELALAFLKGYQRLTECLEPREIELYISVGLEMLARNRRTALAFMEGTLKASETYIAAITRACRLVDVRDTLAGMLRALVGYDVELGDLSALDSDELIERGSSVICLYRWLYLPARIRRFDDAALNRSWYMLMAVAAAGMLAENSFPRVHGHPDYETCQAVVGNDALRLNLFQIIEHARVLQRIRQRWPGATRLVGFGLETEFSQLPAVNPADRLFRDATSDRRAGPAATTVRRVAAESLNFFDTARRLEGDWVSQVLRDRPGLDKCALRTFAFLPDFLFPGAVSSPPRDGLVADLKRAGRRPDKANADQASSDRRSHVLTEGEAERAAEDTQAAEAVEARYVYDEWSHQENDYYRDYCLLHERVPESATERVIPPDVAEQARRVSRVFERFRPDLARREKYLLEGDAINQDLLLKYLVRRRKEPSPRADFYEKRLIRHRDLAIIILLDSSGSTGELVGDQAKTIEIEKHAAIILGQGLASLGDRFSICGFSSSGRENCAYLVYKDFDEKWGRDTIARVLSIYPLNSTRIGPALRHSGFRLSRVAARQRLIIVITDGKPTDSGYDPATRYAQYDVRMACEENSRLCIDTFGISTTDDSAADMDIMFPKRRYAILSDIRHLPRLLPQLYIRLTV